MANPTTNYGFVLPTATDLVTDLPADFDVALQGVDTRLKALQPGTTLGDLAYSSATANTNTRLGIGTTNQVLSVVGGVPAWATVSAGSMTLLSTTTLSGQTTTISSISQNYTNLFVIVYGLVTSNTASAYPVLYFRNSTTNQAADWSKIIATDTTLTCLGGDDGFEFANNASVPGGSGDNAWTFLITNYTNAAANTRSVTINGQYVNVATNKVGIAMNGIINDALAINSLHFDLNAANTFTAGTVKIYGVN